MKNRWLMATAAVGVHISIGSVYAWSVVTKPLMNQLGWKIEYVSLTFSIAIFFLGISAAFFGNLVEKYSPRKTVSIAAVLFGAGLVGAGFALNIKSLPLLYLTYGVFGGMGLGIAYIPPVVTLIKWFPDRRGLATGLAIMGFGFAALICGPIMNRLITSVGLPNMFYILGGVYFTVMLACSQYLAFPPEGWMPVGYKADINNGKIAIKSDIAQLTANQAIRTPHFYLLWLMLFINITCGIAIISVASPLAQEVAKMTPVAAATMVGLMGLFNGLGRIGWSSLSDHIGRHNTFNSFFIVQMLAFLLLPNTTNPYLFQIIIFLIITCYGGGFSTLPAFVGDIFGIKHLGAIYGYILTAWAAAGIVGPMFVSLVKEMTKSYTGTLYVFSALFVAALVISWFMKMSSTSQSYLQA